MTVTNSGGAMKNVKVVNEADLQENVVEALSTNLALVIAAINAVEIDTGDIDLNTDGLEGLITATNALLTTIDADTDAIKTAVEVMDDWDETNRAAVNVIPGQVGVAADEGASDALTQRVVSASDDPGVEVLEDTHNSSDSSFDNTILNFPSAAPMQETKTTLTAAGVTDAIGVSGKVYHTVSYTIALIDTNVVMRAEGSIDDEVSYFNLSSAGTDTTHTANGTYVMTFTGKLSHIRLRFVSEAGGAAATIAPSFMSGN